MNNKKLFIINLVIVIVGIIIFAIAVLVPPTPHNPVDLILYGCMVLFTIFAVTFPAGNLLRFGFAMEEENIIKKMLKYDEYTEVKIIDTEDIPLCITTAIEINNIVFFAKLRQTKKNDTIVCIIAKRDGNFFAEETLTEKGPMFISIREFLNNFTV